MRACDLMGRYFCNWQINRSESKCKMTKPTNDFGAHGKRRLKSLWASNQADQIIEFSAQRQLLGPPQKSLYIHNEG